MSDSRIRTLERKAATGDTEAQDALDRERQRHGSGRHADKVGSWVASWGFRDHFRGFLLGITELGGGKAIAHLHPAYWVRDMETGEGLKRPTSEASPFDLYIDVQAFELQNSDWPTE